MKSTNINKITEKEIKDAICQVGKDKEVIDAFKSISEQELKTILQRERNKKSQTKTVQIWLFSVSSVAASLLVVLTLTVFKKDPSQNLYMAYFDMPAYLSETSRGSSGISETFFDFYNKELYEKALDEIKPVGEDDLAEEPLLKFYVSVCYMKANDISKATKYLSELHDTCPHCQEVQWYLALGYLHEKQTDKAKELLQKIDDKMYTGKAKELLEKLK